MLKNLVSNFRRVPDANMLVIKHGGLGALRLLSSYFDADFYANEVGMTFAREEDALAHYFARGEAQGKRPSQFFSPSEYLATYRDVTARPLEHFVLFGYNENRSPRPVTHSRIMDKHPVVKEWKHAEAMDRMIDHELLTRGGYLVGNADALQFMLSDGAITIDPSESFCAEAYRAFYPDADAFSPLLHYVMWGRDEGRITMPGELWHALGRLYARDAWKMARQPVTPHALAQIRVADAALADGSFAEAADVLTRFFDAPSRSWFWPLLAVQAWRAGDMKRAKNLSSHGDIHDRSVPSLAQGIYALAREDRFSALNILMPLADSGDQDAIELMAEVIGAQEPYPKIRAAAEALFDESFYRRLYPDVADLPISALGHYLVSGWQELRRPCAIFDPSFYRRTTDGLARRNFELVHFYEIGLPEGKRGNAASNGPWWTAAEELDWQAVPSARLSPDTVAAVIIPVYDGKRQTLAAIHAALGARQKDPYAVFVIDDRGPDEGLSDTLAELAGRGLFEYTANPDNIGFVRSVNGAVGRVPEGLDIVLLNADTYVAPGWFRRLRGHVLRNEDCATVTPLSNNATIASYPVANDENLLHIGIEIDALDAMVAKLNSDVAVEAPTGVGFCMYFRRRVIDEIGMFDPVAFPRGYGEENDFCMRALARGWRNLIACDVFVFHEGAVSFGSNKQALMDAGSRQLALRHPSYFALVRRHVRAEPLRAIRRKIDLERLRHAQGFELVAVRHRWRGGVDTYLASRSDRDRRMDMEVHGGRLVSFYTDRGYYPNLVDLDIFGDVDLILSTLKSCRCKALQINSFAGLDWSAQARLMDVIACSGIVYDFVGHDYAAISHHHQLMPPDGIRRGEVDLAQIASWDSLENPDGGARVTQAERLLAWGNFLRGARRREVPSRAAKVVFSEGFPDLAFDVVPHIDHLPSVKLSARPDDGTVLIVVMGALGHHKGSAVLASVAEASRQLNLPLRFRLIGYSDLDDSLRSSGVEVTGEYASEAEALCLIGKEKPDYFFIPSIWPETFCYTLSFSSALGVPPIVFDVGAQGERARTIDGSEILDLLNCNNPYLIAEQIYSASLERGRKKMTVETTRTEA